ncbi:DUF4224 domain-containing protein [Neptuniibacter pectenicola]|uniref:DUF4224 domain-containing protein n=1 Tax=Neptuniibacter pectenicola TaxID=1806669 RepID=UPI00082F464B|nr:DUF4224 domain-containing protein [Neptuniibacter pectenicola]
MSIEFLTDKQLEDLTGYSQPAKQRQVLDKHGIFYIVRPTDGRLRVTPHHIYNPYHQQVDQSKHSTAPDFRALSMVSN